MMSDWKQKMIQVKDLGLFGTMNARRASDIIWYRLEAGKTIVMFDKILVSINPGAGLGGQSSAKDCQEDGDALLHHQCRDALDRIRNGQRVETFLITGRSGAGKTSTSRKIAGFFDIDVDVAKMIIEFMGNASTPLNANSSRYSLKQEIIIDPSSGQVKGTFFSVSYFDRMRTLRYAVDGDYNFHALEAFAKQVYSVLETARPTGQISNTPADDKQDAVEQFDPDWLAVIDLLAPYIPKRKFDIAPPGRQETVEDGHDWNWFETTLSRLHSTPTTFIPYLRRFFLGILIMGNLKPKAGQDSPLAPLSILDGVAKLWQLDFDDSPTFNVANTVKALESSASWWFFQSLGSAAYNMMFHILVQAINRHVNQANGCQMESTSGGLAKGSIDSNTMGKVVILDNPGFENGTENHLRSAQYNILNQFHNALAIGTLLPTVQDGGSPPNDRLAKVYETFLKPDSGLLSKLDNPQCRQQGRMDLRALCDGNDITVPESQYADPDPKTSTLLQVNHHVGPVIYDTKLFPQHNAVSPGGKLGKAIDEIIHRLQGDIATALGLTTNERPKGMDQNHVRAKETVAGELFASMGAEYRLHTDNLSGSSYNNLRPIICFRPFEDARHMTPDRTIVMEEVETSGLAVAIEHLNQQWAVRMNFQDLVQRYQPLFPMNEPTSEERTPVTAVEIVEGLDRYISGHPDLSLSTSQLYCMVETDSRIFMRKQLGASLEDALYAIELERSSALTSTVYHDAIPPIQVSGARSSWTQESKDYGDLLRSRRHVASELTEKNKQIGTLSADLKRLGATITAKDEAIERGKKDIKAKNEQAIILDEQIRVLQKEVEAKNVEIEALNEKVSAKDTEIGEMREKSEQDKRDAQALQVKLNSSTQAVSSLQQSLDDSETVKREIEVRLESNRSELDEKASKLSAIEKLLGETRKALNRAENREMTLVAGTITNLEFTATLSSTDTTGHLVDVESLERITRSIYQSISSTTTGTAPTKMMVGNKRIFGHLIRALHLVIASPDQPVLARLVPLLHIVDLLIEEHNVDDPELAGCRTQLLDRIDVDLRKELRDTVKKHDFISPGMVLRIVKAVLVGTVYLRYDHWGFAKSGVEVFLSCIGPGKVDDMDIIRREVEKLLQAWPVHAQDGWCSDFIRQRAK